MNWLDKKRSLRHLTATYDLASPLFCSGHAQHHVEARPASFIGALAFWWRALAWARIPPDDETPAAWLKRQERRLFGSAETGQGACVLKRCQLHGATVNEGSKSRPAGLTQDGGHEFKLTHQSWSKSGSGTRYLLGQGLARRSSCFGEDAKLTIELVFRPAVKDEDIQEIRNALIALGLFGGFGARTRRGFGSLCLSALSGFENDNESSWCAPKNASELQKRIDGVLEALTAGPRRDGTPEYSAFSSQAISAVIAPKNVEYASASQALNWLGQHYQLFRGWGRKQGNAPHGIGGVIALHKGIHEHFAKGKAWYKPDHDWFVGSLHPNEIARSERAIFGLPIQYFKKDDECKRTGRVAPHGANADRRASPLMFHIHKFAAKRFAIVATLLPAQFLPEGAKLRGEIGGSSTSLAPPRSFANAKGCVEFLKHRAGVR